MTADVGPTPRLEFVLGRADDVRAEAYVRLVGGPAGAAITGALTGPRCRLATTLPTTIPLQPLAGEGPAAARAIITEPSFWTPELPNLYELAAEARTAAGIVAATRQLVGLRRLGVRGRSIWLDGRRWVPRGRGLVGEPFDPARFHAASLVAVITDPTPEACSAADTGGVAIVANFSAGCETPKIVEQVGVLAQHPAVVIAMIPPESVAAVITARSTGTMLVAVEVDGSRPPPETLASGVDCLVARLAPGATPTDAWREHAPAVPIVAWREGAGDGRWACDLLQAQLATWACAVDGIPPWDWAGYIVP